MTIDIILIFGIIIGAILIKISKKRPTIKGLNKIGILLIIISIVMGLPDFLEGFHEGYNASSSIGP